ncbi:helix-turn-helix transcriptional regulator [Amycolatopsis sp. NPDC004378]
MSGSTANNDPAYMTTAEVAKRFRTVEGTVRYWRTVGYGPTGVKVGRHVLYRAADVEAWEEQLTEAAEAERQERIAALRAELAELEGGHS